MTKELRKQYIAHGIPIGEFKTDASVENFVGHVVVGRTYNGEVVDAKYFAPPAQKSGAVQVGSKTAPEHHRSFGSEKELRDAGFRLLPADEALVYRWAQARGAPGRHRDHDEIQRYWTKEQAVGRADVLSTTETNRKLGGSVTDVGGQGAAHDMFFTGPDSQRIIDTYEADWQAALGPKQIGSGAVEGAQKANAIARTALLTADVSIAALQASGPMLNSLDQLKAAPKSIFGTIGQEWLRNPDKVRKAKADMIMTAATNNLIEKYPQLPWSYAERSEFTQGATTLSRIPIGGVFFENFSNAFDFFRLYYSDVQARANEDQLIHILDNRGFSGETLAAALSPEDVLQAGDASDLVHAEELLDMVRYERGVLGDQSAKLVGSLPNAHLTTGRNQRAWEHTLIFLAPQWRRSQLALLHEALGSWQLGQGGRAMWAQGRGGSSAPAAAPTVRDHLLDPRHGNARRRVPGGQEHAGDSARAHRHD